MAEEITTRTIADLPPVMQIQTDKVRTRGWTKFDKWIHGGIGFGLNVILAMAQSVLQTNYEINKKIDAGEEGFAGQKKRFTLGLDGYFKVADDLLDKTNKLFKVDFGADGKTLVEKDADGKITRDHRERAFYSEVSRDVLVLANAGHITTLLTQIFENPRIKPTMVRWLDKREDAKRIACGETITAEELAEREAIYRKLDNDLAGKSMLQMWTARFVGIGMVIASLIGFGKLDQAITKKHIAGEGGLYRVRHGLVGLGRAANKAAGENIVWLRDAVDENPNTPKTYFANRMLNLFGTEVVGSAITAGAQYATLMFKEFFTDQYKGKKPENTTAPVQEKKPQASIPITDPTAKDKAEKVVTEITEKPAREMEKARLAHAENSREVKHRDRTERKPVTEISPRKDAPVESFAMQGV